MTCNKLQQKRVMVFIVALLSWVNRKKVPGSNVSEILFSWDMDFQKERTAFLVKPISSKMNIKHQIRVYNGLECLNS